MCFQLPCHHYRPDVPEIDVRIDRTRGYHINIKWAPSNITMKKIIKTEINFYLYQRFPFSSQNAQLENHYPVVLTNL